jgi:hypothetical protein
MEKSRHRSKEWTGGTWLWLAVLVWFSSSLLSQSAYMAVHGLPYDAVTMLKSLGPLYYLIIALEVVMWAGVITVGWAKVRRLRTRRISSAALPG